MTNLRSGPTDRELEVLLAVCVAGGTKAAAHQLGISVSTVKNHMTNLHHRLGVSTTAAAVYALRKRLP